MKRLVFLLMIFIIGSIPMTQAATLNEIIDRTIRFNDWENAKTELDEYTKANPNDAEAFGLYAVTLSQLKMYDEAIRACRTAINLEKSDEKKGEYYYNLGTFYYTMGIADVAVQMYEKSINLNGMLAQPYYMLGVIYYDKQDLEKCVSYWTQYTSLCDDTDRRERVKEAISKVRSFREAEEQRIANEKRAAEEAKRRKEEHLQNLKDELSDSNKESTNLSDYHINESVGEAEFEGLD